MNKLFAAGAVALSLVAGQATAGGMSAPLMEDEVETQAAAGSRAGILVPILALILIGLAISNGDDDNGGGEMMEGGGQG